MLFLYKNFSLDFKRIINIDIFENLREINVISYFYELFCDLKFRFLMYFVYHSDFLNLKTKLILINF